MLLLNYVVDFVQKRLLNSFLALVTSLFKHGLPPNLLKYGNIEVEFWIKVRNQKIKDLTKNDFHWNIFRAEKFLQRLLL